MSNLKSSVQKATFVKVALIFSKILLIALGAVVFLLYAGPLALGEINLGSAFGYCVSAVLILAGIFLGRLIPLVKKVWLSKAGKAVISVILFLAVLFVGAFSATMASIVRSSHYSANDEKTVLVLGCIVYGSTPSNNLRGRANVAADYLEEHPDAKAILCGGQGENENISEGECLYNLLRERGIDSDRLFVENESTRTVENIKNAKEIIEEKELSDDIAIATSDYHEKRASMICESFGFEKPASIPSNSARAGKPAFFTREVFGVWAQWLSQVIK